ncbi:MAG: FkbM family methyltransferase, partial [Clostridiales bacterium]|nr:FkbM family methyltransferase [Candidatus Equinaster intestinalis]
MTDLWTQLQSAKKPIFLYGTGNGADKILNELEKRNITVSGVFASNGFVRNREFRGFHVVSFDEAIGEYGDIISLVSFGSQLPEVMENIKKIASVCETYAPDVPVIEDNEIFDAVYYKNHENEIKAAYELLADELSKKVYKDIISYKLTGKLEYLFDCETSKEEAYKLLNFKDGEAYIDLGAYNGDTVEEFAHLVKNYEKIIAVEPDKRNFRKLENNVKGLHNVETYNGAIGDKSGKVFFSQRGGRNSAVDQSGEEIPMFCVDDILAGGKATYIKMDIEGQEESAIIGAQNTIKKFSPKLNVAAYHRNSDLFKFPLLLHEINPQYKFYLRHHPYIPAWDTNY